MVPTKISEPIDNQRRIDINCPNLDVHLLVLSSRCSGTILYPKKRDLTITQLPCAASILAVSDGKNLAPQNQKAPAINMVSETTKKATFIFERSRIAPMSGGEIASPKRWMIKMFSAKAVARTLGRVTFASAVFDGPVLKNKKKTARKMHSHAPGKRT